MTQTAGKFAQVPNILLHGYPELSMQDRYAVVALISVCWEEKFYPISLRRITEVTGVSHSLLHSRGGAKPREGVLNRLKRLGIIDFKEGRGDNEGRVQTFVKILYGALWRENSTFTPSEKVASVSRANSREEVTVSQSNTSVRHANTSVSRANSSVSVAYTSVSTASSNGGTYTIDSNTVQTINTEREKGTLSEEPYKPELPTLSGFAPATPTAPSPVVEVSHSQEKQPISQEKLAEKKEAQTSGYTKDKPNKHTSKTKIEQPGLPLDLGPLVMPDASVPWSAGTAVAVSEYLRNKRYTPGQRANQENAAKRMLREFSDMTRPQFEEIFTDWAKWWHDHDKGFFTLADLLVKGKNNEVRLQSALDRLEAKASRAQVTRPTTQAQQQQTNASNGIDTFAHVPAFGGKTDEQLAAELVEDLAFLRSRGMAI